MGTTEKQCKAGWAYSRAISSFNSGDESYTESSTLVPRAIRTICRNKKNGQPVDPSVSDTTETAPASAQMLTLSLSDTGGSLTADIRGSDECPGDTLHLTMSQIN